MKALIVYYSFSKNNETLAMTLKQRLDCDVLKIESVRPRNFVNILLDILLNRMPKLKGTPVNVMAYDCFILIAPIWAGKIASPMRSFIKDERHALRHCGFITACGGGDASQHQKVVDDLNNLLLIPPLTVVELWISDLLRNGAGSPSRYRLKENDLLQFEGMIKAFLEPLMFGKRQSQTS